MPRDELMDFGNYIYALAMCEAVLLPSNKNETHAKRLASNLLTAAEVLEQVGDPKFFIVKYFLHKQGLKAWIMRKLLYPTQLQDDFSKYLDESQKHVLKH